MGLKQSIVVVNKFSAPKSGGGSTNGATPGRYVQQYMARPKATETLAPIRRDHVDDFVMRYMARAEAVESAGPTDTVHTLKMKMSQAQGQGGVAFGYGQVSLSDDQLAAASADLQAKHEAGKTWMKTVLSFDEQYLRENKLVPEDFELTGRGGYRGHLDQMKLRMAIMHGMDRMSSSSSGFDDLRYVGVIQVDTENVHCHLAMLDAGRGYVRQDGTQRGKLLPKQMNQLRRGIDSWLDEKQKVAHLSSAVSYERSNVVSHIKRWAVQRVQREALPQLLIATLPQDRRLWRSGTNDARMQRANQLITELVEEELAAPDSPLPEAMDKVRDYAYQRRDREGLDVLETQKLIDRGREQITERAVNGVYSVLRSLPQSQLQVRTPMLEVMTMDYEDLTASRGESTAAGPADELEEFGYRMRSYSTRRREHKKQAQTYQNLSKQWHAADDAGAASADSRALVEFYEYEAWWNRALMQKYSYYMPVLDQAQSWMQRQEEIQEYGQRLQALIAMRQDVSLQRMKDPSAAEATGRAVYDQSGGGVLCRGEAGKAMISERIEKMSKRYQRELAGLEADLQDSGQRLVLHKDPMLALGQEDPAVPSSSAPDEKPSRSELWDPQNASRLEMVSTAAEEFQEVKALDLHHLHFDFTEDVPVGDRAFARFHHAARQRQQRLDAAIDYLRASGQSKAVEDLPRSDVITMSRLATGMARKGRDETTGLHMLPSRIAALRQSHVADPQKKRSATASLDSGISVSIQRSIVDSVAALESRQISVPESEPETAEPGQ